MQQLKTVKLGEVCIINPARKSILEDDEPVSFLAMADVSEEGTISNEQQKSYGSVKKGFTYFEQGDVLIAKITPCFENGKGALTNSISHETGFGSTEFHVIRPTSAIDARYVFYLTRTPEFRAQGKKNMTGSAGQQRVPANFLQTYPIPLPPLPEQRHIAAVLDRADALRQKDRQLLAYYEQLPQAVFLQMFGEFMAQKKDSLSQFVTINPRRAALDDGMKVSFVPMNAVGEKGEFDGTATKQVKDVKTGFTYFAENDVLFAKITPCMENGKGAIAKGLINGVGFGSTEFHVMRANDKITPEFIYYLLAQKSVRKLAEDSMTGSAGQKRVSTSFFDKLKIELPPIALQIEFAETVAQMEQQKAIAKQQLAASEALFQSLLHAFFGRKA